MHTHTLLELYGFFAAGQALHVLRRASAAIQSAKNPIKSRREYVSKFWDVLLIRGVFAGCAFWGWFSHPDLFVKLTGYDIQMPAGPVAALLFGLCSDLVLDWVSQKLPWLKREIPTVPNGDAAMPPAPPTP